MQAMSAWEKTIPFFSPCLFPLCRMCVGTGGGIFTLEDGDIFKIPDMVSLSDLNCYMHMRGKENSILLKIVILGFQQLTNQ